MTNHADVDSMSDHDRMLHRQDAPPDVQAELQRLASELRRGVLNAVWRQWQTLGAGAAGRSTTRGATPSARPNTRALIDPEALVLVSLMLSQDERRLGDILYGWAAQNSALLSVQRMKNLHADYPGQHGNLLAQRLAWFAAVAIDEGKDLRWRSLARLASSTEPAPDNSPDETVDTVSVGQTAAYPYEIHSRAGVREAGGAPSARARLTDEPALLLRLRLGLGIGVKADLLGYLLAIREEWAPVRSIAAATRFTPAAVRRAADDLAAARLIESRPGQPTRYRASYDAWAPLLGLDGPAPGWVAWHERFVFSVAVFHWAQVARDRPLSPYAFGAHGRDLVERFGVAFEHDADAAWGPHSAVRDWGEFVVEFIDSQVEWMDGMG